MKLYEKLHAIQCEVDKFINDAKGMNYTYTKGSTVLGKIRPLMNEHKLILKQEVLNLENTRQDYTLNSGKLKTEILSKVDMRFTWVDCESLETDVNLFSANGQNDWDKGLGSALTYAERYFLLKYFHIPTDEDDVDNNRRNLTQSEPAKPTKAEPEQWLNKGTDEYAKVAEFIRNAVDKKKALASARLRYKISKETAEALLA